MKRVSWLPIVALMLTGCGGSTSTTASRAGPGPQVAPVPVGVQLLELQPPKGGKRGIIRKMDVPAIQNDLRQIALFYQSYPGRVTSLKLFKDSMKRDAPKLYQAIEDKTYIIVLNSRNMNSILAYESAADGYDCHLVVRGDGSVHDMPTPELEAALKEQGN